MTISFHNGVRMMFCALCRLLAVTRMQHEALAMQAPTLFDATGNIATTETPGFRTMAQHLCNGVLPSLGPARAQDPSDLPSKVRSAHCCCMPSLFDLLLGVIV